MTAIWGLFPAGWASQTTALAKTSSTSGGAVHCMTTGWEAKAVCAATSPTETETPPPGAEVALPTPGKESFPLAM